MLWGLHWIDALVIATYVLAIVWIGYRLRKRQQSQEDFFLAGRRLRTFVQFFLSFGNATNADQAVAISREVFRQGLGGMWIQYLVLFLTPFYWFIATLYRRSRIVTLSDFFIERFQSHLLASLYAGFTVLMAIIGGAVSFVIAGKTASALLIKPPAAYTAEERQQVALFAEYHRLQAQDLESLSEADRQRLVELHERAKRGELRSIISYVEPTTIYLFFAAVVALYTLLGGFAAAAWTNVLQGFLILSFSCLLIPAGMLAVGGFSGLRERLPEHFFAVFGNPALTDYGVLTVMAMSLANLVSIIASAPLVPIAGSAQSERAARVGLLGGMFAKRIVMLFWALIGLVGAALFAGQLHDPELLWGSLMREFLGPGLTGLMLIGMFAANMSTMDTNTLTYAALFVRNLYTPLVPGRPEHHYVLVGRVTVVVILFGAAAVALWVNNVLDLFKYFITLPAIFGAPIWLGFLWRRLTRTAVVVQVAACFLLYIGIPHLFPVLPWTRAHPALTLETTVRIENIHRAATVEDVQLGRAQRVGERIEHTTVIPPTGIFFETVLRENPADPNSPRVGQGRFHAELWLLSCFGLDLRHWTKAELNAARFAFDALFPFALLILLSLLTRPIPSEALQHFFARLRVPVQPTPEADRQALESILQEPERGEALKLLPGSTWEIGKPSWEDILGFGGAWLLVGLLLAALWGLSTLG
ncbi:MAG: sodium:solute symporter family protein [Candidatus Kapabacteria bacterium]|nr:sodium:solute symporter family protein [Candidatus Kapabacteria bacterium]MDW8225248.1 sodium:solute symporter family protein [Bacteroidota bacterium]